MGKIKNLLIEAMETPIMNACSKCDGLGQVFFEVVRPQGFGRDVGYLDEVQEPCSDCSGDGEVSRLCDCGEEVTLGMGHDAYICEECANA
jgi:DnaJ-class molecular chaperone